MIDGGYFAKRVEPGPDGFSVANMREVCSVSNCISKPPDGWVDHWRHNELGWFNSPEDAEAVIPEGRRQYYRMFAYRIDLTRYRRGAPVPVSVPDDVRPVPIPSTFTSLGFDAVSKSMESILGFECSPLSCNGLASEIPVNDACLFPTEEAATAGAKSFSIEEPEPGEYYVVEVLEERRP